MKAYKSSRYNLILDLKDAPFPHIVANTFSGTVMYADGELAAFLRSFDPAEFDKLETQDSSLHTYLLKNSFVVEASLDEGERVRIEFEQAKYADRQMHLTIAPTERCNLACIYCYESRGRGSSLTAAGRKRMKDFVERRRAGLTMLGVTWYGGEPLLAMRTIEDLSRYFMKLAEDDKIDYHANMITNGTLLDDAKIDLLRELKVNHLQITIDGPEEIHNQRRFYRSGRRASFADILSGLKQCAGKISVGIRINVDKTNIDRYKKLIDQLGSEKLLGPGSGNSISLGLVKDWTELVGVERQKMLSLDDFQIKMNELCDYLTGLGFMTSKPDNFVPKNPCGALSISNFLITSKGDLKKCWIHATGTNGMVGNLDTGLDLTRAEAVKWTAFNPALDAKCSACSLLPVCAGGCPYEMLTQPERKETYCSYMSNYVQNGILTTVMSKA